VCAKVQATMITGRTSKQGLGLVTGKATKQYRQEVETVELSAALLARLGVQEGERVEISNRWGTVTLVARVAELPEYLVFIPYGPWANVLVGDDTGGTGMPSYKGVPVALQPAGKRGGSGEG